MLLLKHVKFVENFALARNILGKQVQDYTIVERYLDILKKHNMSMHIDILILATNIYHHTCYASLAILVIQILPFLISSYLTL